MSASGRYKKPGNEDDDIGFREAVIIAAIILCLLLFFVVLRFAFNICLDVCILDDVDRARRSIAELWRKLCPWWHPRTLPQQDSDSSSRRSDDDEEQQQRQRHVELVETMMSREDRYSRLDVVLPCRKLTAEDMKQWKRRRRLEHMQQPPQDQEGSDEASQSSTNTAGSTQQHGMVCSICLHDFTAGNMTCTTAICSHVFHRHCIHQWVGSRKIECPLCRRPIVSPEALEQALKDDQGTLPLDP